MRDILLVLSVYPISPPNYFPFMSAEDGGAILSPDVILHRLPTTQCDAPNDHLSPVTVHDQSPALSPDWRPTIGRAAHPGHNRPICCIIDVLKNILISTVKHGISYAT